jgi:hypothetical protein
LTFGTLWRAILLVPTNLRSMELSQATVFLKALVPYSCRQTDTYRMRIASFTALMVMLALLPPRAYAQAFDDTRFCQAMQETAIERAAKHNTFTNHVAVVVLCNAKIVDFQMRPGVPVNELPPGWHERMHVLLNQMYCQGPMRAAIDNGWTVAFTIMSADGENHYMTAECR